MTDKEMIDEYKKYVDDITYIPRYLTGRGLKTTSKRRKLRVISGKGVNANVYEMEENSTTDRNHFKGKFVEMGKLKENILSIKYATTNTNIKQPVHISNDVKPVVQNIIDNKFNEALYKKLKNDEKITIDKFVKTMKYDINVTEGLDEYNKQFQILVGELSAGNDNPQIRKKLKMYVLGGMSDGIISKTKGMKLLFELNI